MKRKFDVTGMTCAACRVHVENDVKKVQGVTSVDVSLLTNSMVVDYDDALLNPSIIIKAVKKGGYGAKIASNSPSTTNQSELLKKMKIRLVFSLILFVILLYLSMGMMIGLPLPEFLSPHHYPVLYGSIQLIITIPIVILNRNYFIIGFPKLWKRRPNMDSLVAIGTATALIYGIFILIEYAFFPSLVTDAMISNNLYFESAGAILTLVTVGKYLEVRSKGKTGEAIARLIDLAPKTAFVLKDGAERETPVSEIKVGDIIVIRPGFKIPVDGIILEGESSLDESAITGESMPVDKHVGNKVITATINQSGFFHFRATAVGTDTTLSRIIALVEEAGNSKAPIARLADQISGIFVPIVIGIAIISTTVWLIAGEGLGFALSMGITVLVISCPCALGLATPVAIMVGTGKGAENGILIKSAESFEIAHQVDTVVLDKTGTITHGKPEVTDVISLSEYAADDLIRLASSLETKSEHPLGKAVVQYADKKGISPLAVSSFQNRSGYGVQGTIEDAVYYAGNDTWMRQLEILSGLAEKTADDLARNGKTPIFLAKEMTIIGILALADTIKPTSREAIEGFHRDGIHVVMVTGDRLEVAQAIQKELGIETVHAGILPDGKAQIIADLQKEGHIVAMVGDGINDAVALTKADVGMAIGAGTDIAIESADIILMKSDLRDAVLAIELSRKTIANIKMNLFWAFFYNVIGIPIAAGVFFPLFGLKLSPTLGSLAMSLSSVSVVLNALRLKWFHSSKTKR